MRRRRPDVSVYKRATAVNRERGEYRPACCLTYAKLPAQFPVSFGAISGRRAHVPLTLTGNYIKQGRYLNDF